MEIRLFLEGNRKLYPFWSFCCANSYSLKKYRGTPPIKTLWIMKNCNMEMYYVADNYEKTYENLLKIFLKDKKIISDYAKDLKRREKKVSCIKIEKIKDLSNKQLYQLYKKFYNCYVKLFHPISIMRRIDRIGVDKLREILENKKIKNIDNKIVSLCSTEKDTYTTKEEKDILKAAIDIKKRFGKDLNKIKNSEFLKKKAHELWKKYCWMSLSWYNEPLREEKYYINEIFRYIIEGPEKDLKIFENKKKRRLKERDKLTRKLRLNKKEMLLVKILREFAFLKDHRKGSFGKGIMLSNKIFDGISRKIGLDKQEAKAVTLDEMREILIKNKKPNMRTIRKRLDYYVLFAKPKIGVKIYYGKDADKIKDRFLKYLPKIKKDAVEFKGRTASPGFGKGNARIIKNIEDLNEFKEGEILVTKNTTADFVPIMKKATAIVTEEGGVTSHAAVVGRELGVPYIIGIENATEIFKDGDLIEVDANKGIVRKIDIRNK